MGANERCSVDMKAQIHRVEEALNRNAKGIPVHFPDDAKVKVNLGGDIEIEKPNSNESYVIRDVIQQDGKEVPTLYHVIHGTTNKQDYVIEKEPKDILGNRREPYAYKILGTFQRVNFEAAKENICTQALINKSTLPRLFGDKE